MNGLGKCKKIRQVMRLRQIVRKWRKLVSAHKAAQDLCCKLLSSRSCLVSDVSDDAHFDVVGEKKSKNGHRRSLSAVPRDVPSGHLAVYVGQQSYRRFVIRAEYLNHPVFRALLQQAEKEFGYAQQGGLVIPCDELLFEHILSLFHGNDPTAVRHLDLEVVKNNFCNKLHCSAEPNRILLGNDSRPFLHGFAEEQVG